MNDETMMKRYRKNAAARFSIDVLGLTLAFLAAFWARLDFAFDIEWFSRMALHLPFMIAAECLAMYLLGASRAAWRYISLADVRKISLAILVAHLPFVVERIICGALVESFPDVRMLILPWGIIIINICFSILACVGVRTLRRMRYESSITQKKSDGTKISRTLLIGTGSSSKEVINSIRMHPELGIEVHGIISDNPEDTRRHMAGIPVLGTLEDLSAVAQKISAHQAIITHSDAAADDLRRILDACAAVPLKTCIIPRMDNILSGALDIGMLREISVEDLLHRDPVQLDKAEISKFLHGRRILVTGAGGSIGSEMCRQVLAFEPTELILLERCELFLYEIERELKPKAQNTRIVPRLADICDTQRIHDIFEECKPEVIFHAAAYKHVPMLEYNPGEAIRNNVEGTECIANAAVEHGCNAFVMISTDKAVNPTSVMGTSKRIAELYIQGMSTLDKTRFCAVRFGNVLGSTGSVLPLFKSQINAGGPLTVTHPDMVRYFMTIPEAAQLVMQAATMAHNGEIFVLDMGKPVKIVDLARDLIRLSGKTEKDIPIVFSGTRPGEKLFEELGFDAEKMEHTVHPKIYTGKLKPVVLEQIKSQIDDLRAWRDSQDNAAVRKAMHQIVPEMLPPAAS